MWSFAGKEIIELDSKTLKLILKIPIASYSREFPVADIAGLRVKSFPWSQQRKFKFLGCGEEALAFDYRGRTRRVGVSLGEGKTIDIMDEMRTRMTSLCT